MWALLPRKLQLTIIVASSIVFAYSVEALIVWISGGGSAIGPLRWLSVVVFLIGVVLAAAAQFLWFRVVNWVPWLQTKTFPDLNGTWKGSLESTWVNPDTGQQIEPIPTTVTIRQTLFSTYVSMKTRESKSESTRSFLEPFYDTRRYRLWYSYNNDPQAQFQHRSSPHEGVAFLELEWDVDPCQLTGRYYTARKTLAISI